MSLSLLVFYGLLYYLLDAEPLVADCVLFCVVHLCEELFALVLAAVGVDSLSCFLVYDVVSHNSHSVLSFWFVGFSFPLSVFIIPYFA